MLLAPRNRRAENVRVSAVVVAELKFRDVHSLSPTIRRSAALPTITTTDLITAGTATGEAPVCLPASVNPSSLRRGKGAARDGISAPAQHLWR